MQTTLRPNLIVALKSLADPASNVDNFEVALSFVRTYLVGPDGSIDKELHGVFLNAESAIRLRRRLKSRLSATQLPSRRT
jgi:hypothetical protein